MGVVSRAAASQSLILRAKAVAYAAAFFLSPALMGLLFHTNSGLRPGSSPP